MTHKELSSYIVEKIIDAGADKAVCRFKESTTDELSAEAGKINLFRTNYGYEISLVAIIDNKKGLISINQPDLKAIDKAVLDVVELANSSQPDDAHDISPLIENQTFQNGLKKTNKSLMMSRLDEFMKYIETTYPHVILEQVVLSFIASKMYHVNSNGVDYDVYNGLYSFFPMFTSKEGKNISSFNYTGFNAKDIEKPLHTFGTIERLIKESGEQTKTQSISGKFIGDIIFTPDSISTVLGMISRFIGEHSLISGTSVYKEKLNKQITSSKLTLHSKPRSDKLDAGYFLTNDGFIAQDSTIIKKGVLNTFLLGQYGANKTGLNKAVNNGGAWVIDSGEISLNEITSQTKKGIVLGRLSGSSPNENGDFSGVAKNSFYIEDGKIQFPISETMIAGNIVEMLMNINSISSERINFGSSILPFMSLSGATISGK